MKVIIVVRDQRLDTRSRPRSAGARRRGGGTSADCSVMHASHESVQGQGATRHARASAGRAAFGNLAAAADHVAAGIAARGRKAVLESRRAAKQFHSTGRFQITSRNLGFRVANAMINSRIVRRRDVPTTSPLI